MIFKERGQSFGTVKKRKHVNKMGRKMKLFDEIKKSVVFQDVICHKYEVK